MKNILIALLFVVVVSCQKDEEVITGSDFSIVGTWIEYAADRTQAVPGTVSFESEHFTFVFMKEKSGLLTVEGTMYGTPEKRNFTYSIDADSKMLILNFSDKPNSPWASTYTLTNNDTFVWNNLTLHRK